MKPSQNKKYSSGNVSVLAGGAKNQKDKKSATVLLSGVVASAIVLLVVFLVLFFIQKANSKPNPNSQTDDYVSYAMSDVWSMVSGLQEPDYSGNLALYYSKVTFTINEENYNDDGSGTANVTVITPDMNVVFATLYDVMEQDPDAFSSDIADKTIEASLMDGKCKMLSSTFDVPLQLENGEWKIVPTEEWEKAVTCDMNSILDRYYALFYEEEMSK